MKYLSVALSIIIFSCVSLAQPLVYYHGNSIQGNGSDPQHPRWRIQNSPVQIRGKVYLTEGSVLTIEPGVQVNYYQNSLDAALGSCIAVQGRVDANGTSDNPIRFTFIDVQRQATAIAMFQGNSTPSTSTFKNCVFQDFNAGAIGNYWSGSISGEPLPAGCIAESGLLVDSCRFMHCLGVLGQSQGGGIIEIKQREQALGSTRSVQIFRSYFEVSGIAPYVGFGIAFLGDLHFDDVRRFRFEVMNCVFNLLANGSGIKVAGAVGANSAGLSVIAQCDFIHLGVQDWERAFDLADLLPGELDYRIKNNVICNTGLVWLGPEDNYPPELLTYFTNNVCWQSWARCTDNALCQLAADLTDDGVEGPNIITQIDPLFRSADEEVGTCHFILPPNSSISNHPIVNGGADASTESWWQGVGTYGDADGSPIDPGVHGGPLERADSAYVLVVYDGDHTQLPLQFDTATYHVLGPWQIGARTVHIAAGTVLKFDRDAIFEASGDHSHLAVDGSSAQPVSLSGWDNSRWPGILCENGGHVTMTNTTINDAQVGVLVTSGGVLDGDYLDIKNCSTAGIGAVHGTVRLHEGATNEVVNHINGDNIGISADQSSYVYLKWTDVESNNSPQGGIRTYGSTIQLDHSTVTQNGDGTGPINGGI